MTMINEIVTNYKLGFITSQEFIGQYIDVLNLVGAGDVLSDKMNEVCQPLAQYLVNIVEKKERGSIASFQTTPETIVAFHS